MNGDALEWIKHHVNLWLTEPVHIAVAAGASIAVLWRAGRSCVGWIVRLSKAVYQFPEYLSGIQHTSNIARANTEILLNRLSVATWESDDTGAAIAMNRTFTELTGWTIEDIQGNQWKKVIHPDDLPNVEAAWDRTIRDRIPFEMEYRWRTRWGTDIRGRGTARWQRNGRDYLTGAFDPVANAITDIRDEIADMRSEQKALTKKMNAFGTDVTEWFRKQREDSSSAHTEMLAEIEQLRADYERMKNGGA